MRCPIILLAFPVALAGCVPAAESVAPPPPQPAQVVALPPPPAAADWRDWPVTPGTWAYRQDARGTIALFGPAGGEAQLTLRCDTSARRLYLSRAGAVATPVSIRTTTATRTLPVQPTGGTPPFVAVAFAPGDALLDGMAFSRGHFTVEQAGAPTLVVPAWAEIGRTIEDCRG